MLLIGGACLSSAASERWHCGWMEKSLPQNLLILCFSHPPSPRGWRHYLEWTAFLQSQVRAAGQAAEEVQSDTEHVCAHPSTFSLCSVWSKGELSPELSWGAASFAHCTQYLSDCLNSTAKPCALASCVACLILLPSAIKSCINKPMPVPFFPVNTLTRSYFLVLLAAHFFWGKVGFGLYLAIQRSYCMPNIFLTAPFCLCQCRFFWVTSTGSRSFKEVKKKMASMFPWPQKHWEYRAFFFSLLYSCDGESLSPWTPFARSGGWLPSLFTLFCPCNVDLFFSLFHWLTGPLQLWRCCLHKSTGEI